MKTSAKAIAAIVAFVGLTTSASVWAEDKLKLALGQRGNWDTAVSQLAQSAGIFKTHGLDVEVLWTEGAGESQQATIAGSVDIGLAGTVSAFSAYQKGAPLRVIAAEATGAADYWYVRAESPIRSSKDFGGRTIAYSTNGASTHTFVLALLKNAAAAGKPVATGGPAATFTQVMSGQIDVGWSAPPFGLEAVAQNRIRIVARASDVRVGRETTIRSLVTTVPILDSKREILRRYVLAYKETIDWMYATDDALQAYAEFARVPVELARRVRDEFFPKSMLNPERMSGLEGLMEDGVTFKYLNAPLTAQQLEEVIQIPTLGPQRK